jgi:hypothetical protein
MGVTDCESRRLRDRYENCDISPLPNICKSTAKIMGKLSVFIALNMKGTFPEHLFLFSGHDFKVLVP